MLRPILRKKFSFKPEFDACGGSRARCAGGDRVNGRRRSGTCTRIRVARQFVSSRFGGCKTFAQLPRLFRRECFGSFAGMLTKPLHHDHAAVMMFVGRQEM